MLRFGLKLIFHNLNNLILLSSLIRKGSFQILPNTASTIAVSGCTAAIPSNPLSCPGGSIIVFLPRGGATLLGVGIFRSFIFFAFLFLFEEFFEWVDEDCDVFNDDWGCRFVCG